MVTGNNQAATPAVTESPIVTPLPTTPALSTSTPPAPLESSPPFKIWERPEDVEPGAITGFELVGRAGSPNVPIGPLDSLTLSDGRVVVADASMGRLAVFDSDGTFLEYWGRPVTHYDIIGTPLRLARDADDNVFVLYPDGVVRRFKDDGTLDEDWRINWGRGEFGGERYLGSPKALVVDESGYIYMAGVDNGRNDAVFRITPDGQPEDAWDIADCTARGLAVDEQGQIYLGCYAAILRLDPDQANGVAAWQPFWELDENENPERSLVDLDLSPAGRVAVLISGGKSVTGDGAEIHHDWSVQVLDAQARTTAEWSFSSQGHVGTGIGPGITADHLGRLLVTEWRNQRIVGYDPRGTEILEIGGEQPEAWTSLDRLAMDLDGNIYAIDLAKGRVTRLTPDGQIDEVISLDLDPERLPAVGNALSGATADLAVGPDGNLYLAAEELPGILRFSPSGEFLGELPFQGARALAFDGAGILYAVSESAVRKLDTADGTRVGGIGTPPGFDDLDDIAIIGDQVFLNGSETLGDQESDDGFEPGAIRRFSLDGADLGGVVVFENHQLAWEVPAALTADAAGNVYTISFNLSASDPVAQPNGEGRLVIRFFFNAFSTDSQLFASGDLGLLTTSSLDLVISPDGQRLYITDPLERQVLIYERISP